MKVITFLMCLVLIALSAELQAQSITTGSVPGTAFCAGDAVDIPYTATGTYTSGNSFTVQISDKNGSFQTKLYNAGSLRTKTSGSIRAVIPGDIEPSSKYRFRVISSDPFVVSGNDNGTDIGLGPIPNAHFGIDDAAYFRFALVGVAIPFQSDLTNAGVQWDFGPDANPQFSSEANPSVTYATEGYKTVRLTAFSFGGCSKTSSNNAFKNFFIGSCFPAIPRDAHVDSAGRDDPYTESVVWVVPGGFLNSHNVGVVYAEAGASVHSLDPGSVYYMKAGSVLEWGDDEGYVVYEDGFLFPEDHRGDYLKCDNLEFNYTDAPPYRSEQASVHRRDGAFLQVYPNPASDRLTVIHNGMQVREIVLRNSLGAEVLYTKPAGDRTSIDLTQCAEGLYFIDVLTPDGIETQKIVIQK